MPLSPSLSLVCSSMEFVGDMTQFWACERQLAANDFFSSIPLTLLSSKELSASRFPHCRADSIRLDPGNGGRIEFDSSMLLSSLDSPDNRGLVQERPLPSSQRNCSARLWHEDSAFPMMQSAHVYWPKNLVVASSGGILVSRSNQDVCE